MTPPYTMRSTREKTKQRDKTSQIDEMFVRDCDISNESQGGWLSVSNSSIDDRLDLDRQPKVAIERVI